MRCSPSASRTAVRRGMQCVLIGAFALATGATAACNGDNIYRVNRLRAVPLPGDSLSAELPGLAETADYLDEVAFGAEFGTTSNVLRKWVLSPSVELVNATDADAAEAAKVLAEIGAITGLVPTLVPSNGDIRVFFVPVDQFVDVIGTLILDARSGTVGAWGLDFNLIGATVVIDQASTGNQRRHYIREELTQAFGLFSESGRYSSSVLYRGDSEVTAYAPIDVAVLELLYSPLLQSGMTRPAVAAALGALN